MESDKKMKEVEAHWQNQVAAVRASLDSVKEQMERESQQKIEALIQQHRSELGSIFCSSKNQLNQNLIFRHAMGEFDPPKEPSN